jgi:hypothetical protein
MTTPEMNFTIKVNIAVLVCDFVNNDNEKKTNKAKFEKKERDFQCNEPALKRK